jgi:2-dehydro-3-deoxygalactonokinase
MKPRLLALDWGSSRLRAHLLGDGGALLDERSSADGASTLSGGAPAFEAALRAIAGDWLDAHPGPPVLASGMVGSAHGWREARYADCPVALDALHEQAVLVDGARGLRVRIVPGLACQPAAEAPDVMRGEETQLAGLLDARPELARARIEVVMPGTHSKWVHLAGGHVQGFATRMTGEVFALLRTQSVLARLMTEAAPGAFAADAFDAGVAAARRHGGDLLHLLFGVRTQGLFDRLPGSALADHLSGLLIGSEVAAGVANLDAAVPLVLVGDAALLARYRRALAAFGRDAVDGGEHLAARGLWRIAQRAGWLGTA